MVWLDDLLEFKHNYNFSTKGLGQFENPKSGFYRISYFCDEEWFTVHLRSVKSKEDKDWHVNLEIETVIYYPFPMATGRNINVISLNSESRKFCIYKPSTDSHRKLFKMNYGDPTRIPMELKVKILDCHGFYSSTHLIDHSKTLVQSSDFKLIVGDKTIEVNKFVLSSKSQVFEEMFKATTANDDSESMKIEYVSYEHLIRFIGFFYGIQPFLYPMLLHTLLELCRRFDTPSIRNIVLDLVEKINKRDLLHFLYISEVHHLTVIQDNFIKVIDRLEVLKQLLQYKGFLRLSDDTMNYILKGIILRIDN